MALKELQMPFVKQRTESILAVKCHDYLWTNSTYGTAHTVMLVTQRKVAVAIVKNGGVAKGKLLTRGNKVNHQKQSQQREQRKETKKQRKEQKKYQFGINHRRQGTVMTTATATKVTCHYELPESEEPLKVLLLVFLLLWEVHLRLEGIL